MSAHAAIVTTALTKHFGAVHALEDLNLEVSRGEILGYLGPNGAGKTTTIRLLLDFLRPTSGTARVLGGSGADPEVRRRIGYLPAELRIDPRYTASDLLDFYGRLRGGHDRRWVSELLERFDLDPRRRVGELSTGNRRKVGIVAATAHRPELLLLDEPSSGLDPLLQHEFQALVRELAADGATVLLSSHVLPEVELLAHRVAILREGRLVTIAGVEELRRQARQRIDLHLEQRPRPAAFAEITEVVEAQVMTGNGPTGPGAVLRLVIDGSAAAVFNAAAPLGVVRVVSHEADLDEVFLRYYHPDRDIPAAESTTSGEARS
ncbi:ABC transporter ATP-binding protein [Actinomadura kijaniata]|uniref:ABC-2 type transport system ATP-binding protein n=1 Tax=Actinomadura namibiensis TaxID=182080 RepID=A0A7W3LR67_ACTNM|nr:ABC transporter ATP-binding protein [Actinomadura namibiensis]MBA8952680.1 ABC-2 type transport system ATP-binding protein [Actinomadura namibiensis]